MRGCALRIMETRDSNNVERCSKFITAEDLSLFAADELEKYDVFSARCCGTRLEIWILSKTRDVEFLLDHLVFT